MKVKDFIDWVRPISALNPETELNIIYSADEFDISHLHISDDEVTICLKDSVFSK